MMNKLIIKDDVRPDIHELMALYDDVGWTAYTQNPQQLKDAIDHSLKVWTVWDEEKLVALARVVGDGISIVYIQDILILKNYQTQGIGSNLLKNILESYQSVRQIVLLTEDSEKTVSFYTKNGLVKVSEYDCIAFMK